jgi:hypothetical protein
MEVENWAESKMALLARTKTGPSKVMKTLEHAKTWKELNKEEDHILEKLDRVQEDFKELKWRSQIQDLRLKREFSDLL